MLDRTHAPQVHSIGNLTLPQSQSTTLDNGVTLQWLDGGSQEVSQLNIIWTGGTAEASTPATARLMATMMSEGTTSMSGAEISETLDFHGAMLRVGAAPHHTVLNLTSLNSMARGVLPVLRDILHNADFPADTLASYRDKDIRDLLLAQSNVMTLAQQAIAPLTMGADHPQAHVETPDEIAAVDRECVESYYRRVVAAGGCHALLSGRITPALLADVADVLASLPAADGVPVQVLPYHAEAPRRVDVTKPGAVQAAVQADIPAIRRDHPDYVPLRFAVTALGGYFGSRLMKNIREDKGYTYGIGSYLLGSREGGVVSIAAQTDPSYVDLLIDEVRAELRRLADVPLDQGELMSLRQYMASSLMEYLDSPFATMDYYKTRILVELPDDYFSRQVELARTCDSALICDMARKYLDPAALRIAVVK